ncbi:MAG: hypothetical protein GIKADHBN_01514 [Phycisphaerales bacterium]|nr:hypothetical protein [Phycisphaerales bacterium]
MSALSRQPESPFAIADWHADVTQLLDEHHLVAVSHFPRRKLHFASSLGRFLSSLRDVEVCNLYGRYIDDLDSFCDQLEHALPGPTLDRRIDGPSGVTALLRHRHELRGKVASKYRYYIWHDADHLLERDRKLFGRLVDAFAGVAAEAEYCDDDLLLIHRAVFVGGPLLDLYAEDPRGQFQQWAMDEGHDEAFWEVVTGIEKPPVLKYSIDML